MVTFGPLSQRILGGSVPVTTEEKSLLTHPYLPDPSPSTPHRVLCSGPP